MKKAENTNLVTESIYNKAVTPLPKRTRFNKKVTTGPIVTEHFYFMFDAVSLLFKETASTVFYTIKTKNRCKKLDT